MPKATRVAGGAGDACSWHEHSLLHLVGTRRPLAGCTGWSSGLELLSGVSVTCSCTEVARTAYSPSQTMRRGAETPSTCAAAISPCPATRPSWWTTSWLSGWSCWRPRTNRPSTRRCAHPGSHKRRPHPNAAPDDVWARRPVDIDGSDLVANCVWPHDPQVRPSRCIPRNGLSCRSFWGLHRSCEPDARPWQSPRGLIHFPHTAGRERHSGEKLPPCRHYRGS